MESIQLILGVVAAILFFFLGLIYIPDPKDEYDYDVPGKGRIKN